MGGYSFAACLSHLTTDHASLSNRSTVPANTRNSNLWVLITFLPYLPFTLLILSQSCFAVLAGRGEGLLLLPCGWEAIEDALYNLHSSIFCVSARALAITRTRAEKKLPQKQYMEDGGGRKGRPTVELINTDESTGYREFRIHRYCSINSVILSTDSGNRGHHGLACGVCVGGCGGVEVEGWGLEWGGEGGVGRGGGRLSLTTRPDAASSDDQHVENLLLELLDLLPARWCDIRYHLRAIPAGEPRAARGRGGADGRSG